jgi:NitT/TauT family transport system permease protein
MKKWIGTGILIIVWQLAAMVMSQKILPAPLQVCISLIAHWNSLICHSFFSIYRLLAGMGLAIIVGMPIGTLMGYFKKLSDLLSPIIYLLAPIPKIALLPLIMLFFGIGNLSKVFIIFIIMVFQVIVAVHDAVKNIPSAYFFPLHTIKANHQSILIHIVIPATMPEVFTALRIGLATSLSVLFFAETFGTTWGLGFYIMDMWMRLDYTQMYAGIMMLGFLGLGSTSLIGRLENYLCPWGKL